MTSPFDPKNITKLYVDLNQYQYNYNFDYESHRRRIEDERRETLIFCRELIKDYHHKYNYNRLSYNTDFYGRRYHNDQNLSETVKILEEVFNDFPKLERWNKELNDNLNQKSKIIDEIVAVSPNIVIAKYTPEIEEWCETNLSNKWSHIKNSDFFVFSNSESAALFKLYWC